MRQPPGYHVVVYADSLLDVYPSGIQVFALFFLVRGHVIRNSETCGVALFYFKLKTVLKCSQFAVKKYGILAVIRKQLKEGLISFIRTKVHSY